MGTALRGWLVPVLFYVVLLGTLGVTTKVALRHVSWQDVIVWTAIVYAIIAIGMLLLNQASIGFGPGTVAAIASAVLASTALIALYIALGRGDAGVVIPVGSAYPVVTLVLAAIFLSESISAVRVGGALLVIAGVVLISLNN